MKRCLSVLLLGLASALQAQVPVPATGCYHSAFTPNDPGGGSYGHVDFERLANKTIAVEMFYTGWPGNRLPDFPVSTCNIIVQNGAVPHLTWEPWVSGIPYPLDGIIDGSYDTYLIGYALQTMSWGKPLFIRVGHEMNGNWYPWCGTNNGGSVTTGFGDPSQPDGPERFVAAFRHIRHLFDSVGVQNVSWVWCVNNYAVPYEDWNQPENFYPGDDVVDWIGLDGYNWGTSQSWSNWTSFLDTFTEVYNRFKSSPKPLMIGEFASTELGGEKGRWIRDAFIYTKLLFTRIKAITWFNINKETDWRINSSTAAQTAYRDNVADAYFLGSVPVTSVASAPRLPQALEFRAPTPNPSNGGVRLMFALPEEMSVKLEIRTILGQTVRLLEEGPLGAGEHTTVWDATGTDGRRVATGTYFAVLVAGGRCSVQKLIIAQ